MWHVDLYNVLFIINNVILVLIGIPFFLQFIYMFLFWIPKKKFPKSDKKGKICVCQNGGGYPFSEEEAAQILSEDEIEIIIDLHDGDDQATAWGCDLTYDYVKINGDYRT